MAAGFSSHVAAAGAFLARTGLTDWPRAVLFSRRRFKQTGAKCFGAHAPQIPEVSHAVAS